MKNKIILTGLIITFILGCKRNFNIDELPCIFINFKYYHDEENYLGEISNDYIFIGIDSSVTDESINNFTKSKPYFDKKFNYEIQTSGNTYKHKYTALKLRRTCSCEEITWILDDVEKSSIINYAHYTIQTDNCQNMIWETIGKLCVNSYGNIFYVKLKSYNDTSILNNMLSETYTKIIRQDKHTCTLYFIYADKNSNGDAHHMANYFYETGLFEFSEPSIFKLVVKK